MDLPVYIDDDDDDDDDMVKIPPLFSCFLRLTNFNEDCAVGNGDTTISECVMQKQQSDMLGLWGEDRRKEEWKWIS